MIVLIEAFKNNEEVLGNLDGQAIFECKDYKKNGKYKFLKDVFQRKVKRVDQFRIYSIPSTFSDDKTLLEVWNNPII